MSKSNLNFGENKTNATQPTTKNPSAFVAKDGGTTVAGRAVTKISEGNEVLSSFLEVLTAAKDRYCQTVGADAPEIIVDKLDSEYPVAIPYIAVVRDDNVFVHTFALNKAWAGLNFDYYGSNISWDVFQGRFGERQKDGTEQILTPITPVRMVSEEGIEELIVANIVERKVIDKALMNHIVYAGTTSIPQRHKIAEGDMTIFGTAYSQICYTHGQVTGEAEYPTWGEMRKSPFEVNISFQDGRTVTDLVGNYQAAQFALNIHQRSSGDNNQIRSTARCEAEAIDLGGLIGDMDQVYIPSSNRNKILDEEAKSANPKYDGQLSYKAMLTIRGANRPADSTSLENLCIQLSALPLLDLNFQWWDAFSATNVGANNARIEPGYDLGTVGYETNPSRDYSKDGVQGADPIVLMDVLGQPMDISIGALNKQTWEALMSRLYMHSLGVCVAIPRDGDAAIMFEPFGGSWSGYCNIMQAAMNVTGGHFAKYFSIKTGEQDQHGDSVTVSTLRTQVTGTYSRMVGGEVIQAPVSEQLKYLPILEEFKGDQNKMSDYSRIMSAPNQASEIQLAWCREFLNNRLDGNWTEAGEETIKQFNTKFLTALAKGMRDNREYRDGTPVGKGITFYSDKQGYVPQTREERQTMAVLADENMFTTDRNFGDQQEAGYSVEGYRGGRRANW